MEDDFVPPAPVPAQVKKKRSRSTKKSLAAQNEKRLQFLKTLLDVEVLPKYVSDVLIKEDKEKGEILKLCSEELERFWDELQEFLKRQVSELLASESVDLDSLRDVILAVVNLLQYSALFHDAKGSISFLNMAITLNVAMTQPSACNPELQNEICKLSEYCCIKDMKLGGEFYLDTLNFLFDLTLDKSPDVDLKAEVKRVWEMRVALARMNLRTPSCEVIVNKLARVVVSPAYLSSKEGRQFIAFTFTLDTKLIKRFHQTVKDFLPKCRKGQACSYGEVYYSAWLNGAPEVRQILETQCIQNWMSHVFVFPRKKQELTHTGQNVLALLSYLHHNRTSSLQSSKVLTELYMPLLWRYLRSGNNIERCNAAEVFLDVYPLEKPGSGRAEESEFFNKQHGEMVDLLTDTCHVVRIIAVKGICNSLCHTWNTFPQDTIQVLMRNLVALANDGSSAAVRRTLYEGLSVMLCNSDCAVYLGRVLPSLRDYIHDENERVRRTFIKLLINVKGLPDPAPFKYWKIVSVKSLAVRLELEGSDVGGLLSRLLMSSIYSADINIDKFLFRLIKFIQISPKAARNLFQYSTNSLDYKGAVRVMLTILINLRAYVKKKEESFVAKEQEEKESGPPPAVSKRKKRRSNEQMQTITEKEEKVEVELADGVTTAEENDKENSSQQSNSSRVSSCGSTSSKVDEEADEYSKPGVAHALVDIVSLLWSLHSMKLAEKENEVDHNNLLDVACISLPLLLKYYKGSPTYFALIHLSSLVPASKLAPVSTVCSACISHLKQVAEVTPQSEINVIVHALCAWNRFVDIQDLVIDWLDQAFRCEGLNQSQAQTDEVSKQRRVRFVAKGGKPMLALRLLDAVFSHPLNCKRVVDKSYSQVLELYTYMERIKTLVDRRIVLGLPFDSPMLSDEFLQKCLYRYMKLMLLLQMPNKFSSQNNSTVDDFNSSDVFREFVQWTLQVVKPMLPTALEEEPDFTVLVLKDVLRTAANLFDLMYAENNAVVKVGQLIQGLLSSESSLCFVEFSMIVMKHLKDLSEVKYGQEDKCDIMRTIVPSLLSQVLKSLSFAKYSKEQFCNSVENLTELKTAMYEVLTCIKRLFHKKITLLETVLKLFTDALVAVLVHDVKQLQLVDVVDKVQELPFVCGVLLSVVCRADIAPLWLATVPSSIIHLYSRDSNLMAAVSSLLHTLAHCGLPLPRPELSAAVKEAHYRVTHFTRDSTVADVTAASDSSFSSESIDVKAVVLPVLSDLSVFLDCPLR